MALSYGPSSLCGAMWLPHDLDMPISVERGSPLLLLPEAQVKQALWAMGPNSSHY